MFYLDWVISLVVLGVYPFAAVPIARSRGACATIDRDPARARRHDLAARGKARRARLIKTFRLEDYASSRVNRSFEEVYRLSLKVVADKARLESLLEALGGVAVAGVIWVAYWRISSGASTVGDFMGLTTALLMAAQPLKAIGGLMARVQEGLAAIESIYGILDEKPTIGDRPGAEPLGRRRRRVRFDHVSFHYGDDASRPSADFSLDVEGGQTVALVGRSGAGKSTIVNLVPRLFDVTGGRILIDGQDIRDVTLASLRGAISIVSQDVTLFDDTIRANIALGKLGAPEDDIVAAAKAAAAHEFILAQPQRLRHRHRRPRPASFRRPASAPGTGARDPQGRADPAARRSNERARYALRAAGAGGAREVHEEAHDARHRAPALDGPERRSSASWTRAACRAWLACRTRLPPAAATPVSSNRSWCRIDPPQA